MSDNPNEISRVQMEALAETVASKVVAEMLIKLGIDHARPLEVQHDFQALREVRTLLTSQDFQADLSHLRKWRQAMESGTSKGILAIIGLMISGIAALLVIGFKTWLSPGQ
jgi:hypothetical protein